MAGPSGAEGAIDAPGCFDADARLLTMVTAFLAEGLERGEPAVMIATDGERAVLMERLASEGINVAHVLNVGDLTVVNANDLLGRVVSEGVLDADAFTQSLGQLIEQALHGRPPAILARVYSGLVQRLVTRGQVALGAQVEALFYTLAHTHAFSLLCAHAMGDFYQQGERTAAAQRRRAQLARSVHLERRITRREQDVLRRMALGHANKDIAQALHISVRTVEAHKANAMRKLGLAERTDVVRLAVTQGWMSDADR